MAVSTPARHRVSSVDDDIARGASVLWALTVTGFRPAFTDPMRPLNPVCTDSRRDPDAVVPVNSAGAAISLPARRLIGLRTTCVPSLHTSEPKFHTPSTALAFVNLTVNDFVSPGASVSADGVTTVEKLGTAAVAV